jgi:hypothetical protein
MPFVSFVRSFLLFITVVLHNYHNYALLALEYLRVRLRGIRTKILSGLYLSHSRPSLPSLRINFGFPITVLMSIVTPFRLYNSIYHYPLSVIPYSYLPLVECAMLRVYVIMSHSSLQVQFSIV